MFIHKLFLKMWKDIKMLNIFLQREQESSRSDAMAFRRKGWSGLTPWGRTRWSRATDHDTKQEREQTAQGKKGRGTWEESEEGREAETAAVWQKRLPALLGTGEKPPPSFSTCLSAETTILLVHRLCSALDRPGGSAACTCNYGNIWKYNKVPKQVGWGAPGSPLRL